MDKSRHTPFGKKILILSTYFPPEAEIAAARLKNIIRQLRRLGWEVCCVAPTDPAYDYSADEVLRAVTILSAGHRAGKTAVLSGGSLRRRLLRGLTGFISRTPLKKTARGMLHVFRLIRWTRKAYALSLFAITRYGISTVLATAPGIEAAYTGAMLKKKLKGIHIVCEYRDIISGNLIYRDIQSRLENALMRKMEAAALPSISRFIFLTEGIRRAYQPFVAANAAIRDGIVLTNGYDRESYPPSAYKKSGRIMISHIGHLYGNRSAVNIAKALARFEQLEPQLTGLLHLRFIGKTDSAQRDEITRFCRAKRLSGLSFLESVPHEQALALMMSSDVNLIITHSSGSEYAIPGKLFEYIGAGRPILALSTDPLLTELIQVERLGWVCPNEPEAIVSCLQDICRRWLEDELKPIGCIEKFDISNIAKNLDAYLTELA